MAMIRLEIAFKLAKIFNEHVPDPAILFVMESGHFFRRK